MFERVDPCPFTVLETRYRILARSAYTTHKQTKNLFLHAAAADYDRSCCVNPCHLIMLWLVEALLFLILLFFIGLAINCRRQDDFSVKSSNSTICHRGGNSAIL